MKISEEDALKIVEDYISSIFKTKMKIIPGGENNIGWIFYYNSFNYVTTTEQQYFLLGCYPIIVTFDGNGYITSPYWNGDDENYLKQLIETKPDF